MSGQKEVIGAKHDFHDRDYAREWEARYMGHPQRQILFKDIGDLLEPRIKSNEIVLELGVGPGLLAEYLLNRFLNISYLGLDFSPAMLEVAGERLKPFGKRFVPILADLTDAAFAKKLRLKFSAVVSCWSLHDLGSAKAIRHVYSHCRDVLDGILINADFVKPAGTEYEYESGRISIEDHLQMLGDLGYRKLRMVRSYEVDVEKPTAANNYICLFAEYRAKIE